MLQLNENSYVELSVADLAVKSLFRSTDFKRISWEGASEEDKEICLARACLALENLRYPQSVKLKHDQTLAFPRYKRGVEHKSFKLFSGVDLQDFEMAQILQAVSYNLDPLYNLDNFAKNVSIGKESRSYDTDYIKHKAMIENRFGLDIDAYDKIKHWLYGTY